MGMKDCVQGDANQKSENFLPLFFLKEPARCNCIIIQSIAFNGRILQAEIIAHQDARRKMEGLKTEAKRKDEEVYRGIRIHNLLFSKKNLLIT
jgi:hypothetical protein